MNTLKFEVLKHTSLLLLFLMLLQPSSYCQTLINYTESSDIIANPERGFQKYSITNNNYNTTNNYSNINEATIAGWRSGADKVTVIFRYFLLDAYLNSNISQTYLNNIQIDFNRIRNAGLKCIVRFSYSNGQSGAAQQPVKAQILQHLNQLAPILETNKDIILTHQAGLIGTWGEWYYTNSAEFGTDGNINAAQWQNRKDIIDAMLNATPAKIPLQVRYPAIKTTMYGNGQLNATTAFQNTPNARIGFFNDAFLNNWGDMGTYNVNNQDQNPVGTQSYLYLSNETQYTPMTGETNGLNPPRTNGANAVIELDLTNWSCLNRDYYTQNFTNWINSGHYNDIVKKLGYRLVLTSGNFNTTVKPGGSFEVDIQLSNKGWAAPFLPRLVEIVLENISDGTICRATLPEDPRKWLSNTSARIHHFIGVPSNFPPGNYKVYLSFPDPEATLYEKGSYSIQVANTNTVWNSDKGYNYLAHNLTISSTEVQTNHSGNLWFQQCYGPLPVELKDFYAIENNGSAHIIWATEKETNNDFFQIEKSKEGSVFESYTQVKGAGNSVSKIEYEVNDPNPYKGITYYRLKQVNFDGSYSYSKTVFIKSQILEISSLYPNPATSVVNLEIQSPVDSEADISLWDVMGRRTSISSQTLSTGANHLSLPVASLSTGKYFIQIITHNGNHEVHGYLFVK